jgi:hypothetical protein
MKIRNGFVSNSSSSSFIILSKEDTLENTLDKYYDEIFNISDDDNSIQVRFLKALKDDVIRYLLEGEYNNFHSNVDDCRLITNKIDKNNCMYYSEYVNEKVKKLIDKDFNAFYLDISDYGDGGNVIQNAARYGFKDFRSENLYIINDD